MEEKKEKLVIDGNAVYEIDLECLKRKKQKEAEKRREQQIKGQRK